MGDANQVKVECRHLQLRVQMTHGPLWLEAGNVTKQTQTMQIM